MNLLNQTEGTLYLLLWLVSLGVRIWALVDVIRRPEEAFRAADQQTKQFWLIVTAASVAVPFFIGFLDIVGFIAALIYLTAIRPRLRDVMGGRS